MTRTLTPADELAAFEAATCGLLEYYGPYLGRGMTDAQLVGALWTCLGTFDRQRATRTVPAIAYTSEGLQIWASWRPPNPATDRPIFRGRRTLLMARWVYAIPVGDGS